LFKCPEYSFSLFKRELTIHSAGLPPDVGAERRYIFADNTLNVPLIFEASVIGRCRTCGKYGSTYNHCADFISGHNFLLRPLECNAPDDLNGKKLASYNQIV
jgi:hypothetical protein